MRPVTIRYCTTIKDPSISRRQILVGIQELLASKKLKIVHTSESEIIYKGTSRRFVSNLDISRSVDKGVFYLDEADSGVTLEYRIYINSLIYFGIISAVWAGLAAWAAGPALLFLILGFGLNLAITYSLHEDLFQEILEKFKLPKDEISNVKEFEAGSKRVKQEAAKITLAALFFLLVIIGVIVLLPF
ncbi:hypothetical protein [Desertivirga arenae]|uniref:hypothetical protein n=1 Tax=Desertivirga arenae TaxID=2810309 RepID=UPI001A975A91|nr:hypothetical protein [Pedobacter sp. SYSU D00823]